jgi:hypothetical protein
MRTKMTPRSYFYGGFATTLNIILNALTLGKFLWLEGRVRGGRESSMADRTRPPFDMDRPGRQIRQRFHAPDVQGLSRRRLNFFSRG